MKGIRFYLEYGSKQRKRKGDDKGTVVALLTGSEHTLHDYTQEAIASVFDYPDSPVASGAVSRRYLSDECKRIPEAKARDIHPTLFQWLDTLDDEEA